MGPLINPNCAAVIATNTSGKRFILKPSFFIMFFYSLIGLLFSISSNAQTTPENCTAGCTSNDVQIQASYLSNAAGDKLDGSFVCPVSGIAPVRLTLELTTNTPRKGVAVYANIRALGANGLPTGDPIASLGECFGIELNQPTNKVTFQQPFDWSCGTPIALTDVFIAWGTGNKNFCTSSAFQCPATPSKCFQMQGGSFLAIETPQPVDNSDEQCSTEPGGTTAVFNLNGINVTNSSNVTITWWENYTPPSTLSNPIATPGSYNSISKDVYAKIANNSDPTVFSVATVTLTVYQRPNLVITNPAAVCSPTTVNLQAAAVTAGSTLPTGTILSYWTNSNGTGAVANPAAVSAGTFYIKATTNTTPACSDIKSVVVTVNSTPANAAVSVVQPTCTVATGTVTVTAPLDGGAVDYEYNNNDGAWQDAVSFTVAAGAAYSIKVRNKSGNCVSTTPNSGTMDAQPTTLAAPAATVTQPTCAVATGTVNVTNPQSDVTYTLEKNNIVQYTANASGVFNSVASDTYVLKATKGACSGTSSVTVNAQPQTPAKPTLCVVQPTLCGPATGSITVLSPTGEGYEYSKDGGINWQTSTTFSNLSAGSNPSIIAKKDGCISEAASCSEATDCSIQAGRSANTHTVAIDMPSETTVKAFPNPFTDKVKFVITVAEGKNGSLEVFNMMGQKVKTVYQGYIEAGTRTFEISLPAQRIANLVYVFRMGDKQITGKLLQMGN